MEKHGIYNKNEEIEIEVQDFVDTMFELTNFSYNTNLAEIVEIGKYKKNIVYETDGYKKIDPIKPAGLKYSDSNKELNRSCRGLSYRENIAINGMKECFSEFLYLSRGHPNSGSDYKDVNGGYRATTEEESITPINVGEQVQLSENLLKEEKKSIIETIELLVKRNYNLPNFNGFKNIEKLGLEYLFENISKHVKRQEYENEVLNALMRIMPREIQKKIITRPSSAFTGSIFIFDREFVIEDDHTELKIGFQNNMPSKMEGCIVLPLVNLKNEGKRHLKTQLVNNQEKKLELVLEFEYKRFVYKFRDECYSEWCIERAEEPLSNVFEILEIYSIITQMNLKELCFHFIELQSKIAMGGKKALYNTIHNSIIFYNYKFKSNDLLSVINMLVNFIRLKIYEMNVFPNEISSLLFLLKSLQFLQGTDQKINTPVKTSSFIRSSSIDRFSGADNSACLETENMAYNFTMEIIRQTFDLQPEKKISVLHEMVLNAWKRGLVGFITKTTFHNYINEVVLAFTNDKSILKTLFCVDRIQEILKLSIWDKDNASNLIKLISKNLQSTFKYFLKVLKYVLNNIGVQSTSEKEVILLYKGLTLYLETLIGLYPNLNSKPLDLSILNGSMTNFIGEINKIHLNLFAKTQKRTKKGFDSKKVTIFNVNRVSFEEMVRVGRIFDVEMCNTKLDFYILEKNEIMQIIKIYSSKIKKIDDETAKILLIEHVLDKAKAFHSNIYDAFRSNLYTSVLHSMKENSDFDDFTKIGDIFIKNTKKNSDVR